MAAGIQIYNSHGTLQVDENYRNMFLAGSGVGATASVSGTTYPLMAIRSTVPATTYGSSHNGVANYTMITGPDPATTAPVQWWLWDLKSSAPASSAGFQVFNPQGQLVFDSGQKPMRIVDVRSFQNSSEWNGLTLSYPAGRTYATVISRPPGLGERYMESKGTDGFLIITKGWRGGCVWSGTSCTFGWVMVNDSSYIDDSPMWHGDITESRGSWQIMIVDVTGY